MINKRIDQLEDGETCLVEKTIRAWSHPPEGRKAFRVEFENDGRMYYTQKAINLYQTGQKVSCTVRASDYNGTLYYWLDDIEKVQAEELPL
jgi:hypothetical protein